MKENSMAEALENNSIINKSNLKKQKPKSHYEIWSDEEQFLIFENFKKHLLKWKHIADDLQSRTENSVKSFFYTSLRKIKKLKFLRILKSMICFPTFRNNSNFHVFIYIVLFYVNP